MKVINQNSIKQWIKWFNEKDYLSKIHDYYLRIKISNWTNDCSMIYDLSVNNYYAEIAVIERIGLLQQ